MTTAADIVFIKACKAENVIPKFAKINLSVKDDNKKLTWRVARIVMERQLQSKHRKKKKLKKELTIWTTKWRPALISYLSSLVY